MAKKGTIYGGIGGGLEGAKAGSAFGPAGAIAGGVIGAGLGALAGSDDTAERIAKLQGRIKRQESQRRLEDMRFNMAQVLGLTRATTGASNLQDVGSPKDYRTMLESNFRGEIAWEEMRSILEQKIIAMGGEASQSAYESQLLSGAIGAAASALPTLKKTFSSKEQSG
jgi:hypothetical protein